MYARIKYVCSLTHRNFFRVRSRTRANALYRLLTQTVRYKHIYSEMLLDFLSNVMPALCICYCFLLFLYFSLAHIKKLAVFQIYAILDLNVILRKMYHQSKSSYTCFLTYFNLFILCRILPVQTFYGCNQMLFTCIMYTTLFYLIFYDLMVWN